MQKYNKNLMYISFAIYIMLLIWVIMFKWTNYIAVQECIVAFRKLTLTQRFIECKQSFFGFDFTDMVLNALLYLPMGLCFALLVQKKTFYFFNRINF